MKRLLMLLLIAALFAPAAWAASRTWTSSNGRFTTEADLLGFKDGKVKLKKTDGTVIEVPLESLSDVDRRYVEERYPAAAAPDKDGAGRKPPKKPAKKPPAKPPHKPHPDAAAEDGDRQEDKDGKQGAEPEDEPDLDPNALQDIEMKPLRLEAPKRKSRGKTVALPDYILALTQPQRIVRQPDGGGAAEAEFRRLVKKEPKYVAPIPFRGTAKFGTQSFCFALDAVAQKAAGYDRMYFDADGNGDLTDDPVVSAAEAAQTGNVSQSRFPRVNVTLNAGGEKIEYAFLLSTYCTQVNDKFNAAVMLQAAMARDGYIVRGKKRTRVLLVDRNSNGRFDDGVSVQPNGTVAEGDLLLINPNPKKAMASGGMSADRNLVGKVICLGKNFHRMTVTPSGDKLQLSPIELAMGSVTCSSPAYRAVLTSDEYGVVVISGVKDQKIALAEGTWKVVCYTLDGSAGSGRATAVEATYGNSPPSVTVKKDETVALPFGGAFRAVVTAARAADGKVSLRLEIVGPSGERCRNILIGGGRPPKPRFVIKDGDDKIVHQGDFEYG